MANYKENLTYRDYVVHIFTGVLFNVFMLVALFPILPDKWWEYDLQNEVVWSLVAIPILYLEGHFILAINRLVMVVPLKWYYIILVKKSRKKQKNGKKTKYDVPSKYAEEKDRVAAYKWRMDRHEEIYQKQKVRFFLFLSARIAGQKVVRKDKDGELTKNERTELTTRYYVLSDFFKGVNCSTCLVFFVAFFLFNWWAAGAMFIIHILSRQRARYFSMLYVKYRYKKKDTEKTSSRL